MNPAQLGRFTICDVGNGDAWGLLTMLGNPETVRYLGLRPLVSLDDAAALIKRYQAGGPTKWLAIEESPAFLGLVGLEIHSHSATVTLVSNGKRRGFGREFSAPFVAWIFSHPQIWRVWSYVHVDNIMGQRTTERLGATKEGRLRRFEMFPNISDEPQDVFVYSITRDDLK